MYRGYNIRIDSSISEDFEDYYKIGLSITERTKTSIRKNLNAFISEKGIIQGTQLQNNWFPEVKTHVFLSHSHTDEKAAIAFAGILYDFYKIETFIDSIVWGYSNDLLKQIDKKYCINSDLKSYNYDKRNYSTSHVNLMLSTALNKMIDNCECIFFMNTPNSVSPDPTKNKTASPWIYSEISTTQIIRKKVPTRKTLLSKAYSDVKNLNENFRIEYDLELSHLTEFDDKTFEKWVKMESNSPEDALDNLYSINPIKIQRK